MSKQKYHSQKTSRNSSKNATKRIVEDPFNWLKFSIKIIALFAIIFAVVRFTDSKNYFRADQTNNHVERKWKSFNQFTKTKNVDILLCGNSHIITGIDPFVFSCAMGCNSFILGSPGVSIEDTYFTLGEALNKTKPKLVVIETYAIGGNNDKDNGSMFAIMHYDACNQFWYKFKMMPELFNSDSWVKAWSPSIRNHSFLLTNKEQIAFNKKNPDLKNVSETLDLGRFARFGIGLQDSIMAKYDSNGAPVNGSEYSVSERSKKYLAKIMKLCDEKNVQVLFLTIPMYYKHISDYEHWKQELGKELANYPNSPWINWQMPFDMATFTPECFENTYEQNQHLSNYGMVTAAYKLANILKDGNRYDLPDRSKEKEWLADFSNQPHFIFNQPVPATMQNAYQVAENEKMDDLEVKELTVMQKKEYDQILMKVNKTRQLPLMLHCVLLGELEGEKIYFQTQLIKIQGINPVGFDAYAANIRNDLKVEKIMSIQY